MKEKFSLIPPAGYMIGLLLLWCALTVDRFFTLDNMGLIFRQAAPLLVIACGQTVIVLTQGTDLSLGAVVSLISVLWIWLLNMGIPMGISILISLAVSLLCGIVNGMIAAWIRIPVFIVTLGTQNIYKSLALLLCGSLTIYYRHSLFRTIAKGEFLFLTYSTWIGLGIFLMTMFIIRGTTFGKRLKGLGGNPEALTLSGAGIRRHQCMAFAFAGLMAGIAGLLICCRVESGNPNAGNGLEFSSVAAVLLGGTSLRDGKGGAGGTILGVLMIQILKTGLMQAGVSSIYQSAIIGIVVLLAIIMDAVMNAVRMNRPETAGGKE